MCSGVMDKWKYASQKRKELRDFGAQLATYCFVTFYSCPHITRLDNTPADTDTSAASIYLNGNQN